MFRHRNQFHISHAYPKIVAVRWNRYVSFSLNALNHSMFDFVAVRLGMEPISKVPDTRALDEVSSLNLWLVSIKALCLHIAYSCEKS